MKIGILGGTFDPIHHGHLIIGEYARNSLDLDKLLFIPSGHHPLKNNEAISSSEIRLKALELALESNPFFQISTIEIEKDTTTYTIDTIKELKDRYRDDDLFFIIGTDILFEIEKWKDFKDLFSMVKFLLFTRPGNSPRDIDERIISLREKYGLEFQRLKAPLLDISSTEIRSRMEAGLSIKYLLPERVEEYLKGISLFGG